MITMAGVHTYNMSMLITTESIKLTNCITCCTS